ncbi:hypothetical protein D3C72_1787140 [compost metagenome]
MVGPLGAGADRDAIVRVVPGRIGGAQIQRSAIAAARRLPIRDHQRVGARRPFDECAIDAMEIDVVQPACAVGIGRVASQGHAHERTGRPIRGQIGLQAHRGQPGARRYEEIARLIVDQGDRQRAVFARAFIHGQGGHAQSDEIPAALVGVRAARHCGQQGRGRQRRPC